MEKRIYISPAIMVVGDGDDLILMAAHSVWKEAETSVTTVSSTGYYDDGINTDIDFVTDETGIPPIPNAKMHDLWEEW